MGQPLPGAQSSPPHCSAASYSAGPQARRCRDRRRLSRAGSSPFEPIGLGNATEWARSGSLITSAAAAAGGLVGPRAAERARRGPRDESDGHLERRAWRRRGGGTPSSGRRWAKVAAASRKLELDQRAVGCHLKFSTSRLGGPSEFEFEVGRLSRVRDPVGGGRRRRRRRRRVWPAESGGNNNAVVVVVVVAAAVSRLVIQIASWLFPVARPSGRRVDGSSRTATRSETRAEPAAGPSRRGPNKR